MTKVDHLLIGGGMARRSHRRAFEADDVAADVGDVEPQRHAWIGLDVPQLRFPRLAVHEDGAVVAHEEPHRHRVGTTGWIDGREPRHEIRAEPRLDSGATVRWQTGNQVHASSRSPVEVGGEMLV